MIFRESVSDPRCVGYLLGGVRIDLSEGLFVATICSGFKEGGRRQLGGSATNAKPVAEQRRRMQLNRKGRATIVN